MKPNGWTSNHAVAALVGLAVVQVGILAFARGGAFANAPQVESGFSFAGVETVDARGDAFPLVSDGPTLVLVFHSECAHCQAVADDWAVWLQEPRGSFDVVAVTRESAEVAEAYAETHGWTVEAKSAVLRGGGTALSLTGRTPWVFGLNASGRVVASGHGDQLASVADLLEAASP